MKTAKEIFTEVWREHFGVDAELNKQLTIALEHGYIFEAMERYKQVSVEPEVEPLPDKVIIAQKLVDRLNDYQRQLNSDYGFVNKQKISYKVKELKKIIQIVQTV